MKITKMISIKAALLLVATSIVSVAAHAQSDFDSLGTNEGILKRARSLNTQQQVRIVQKRAVDRDLRFEIGAAYGGVAGGNSYLNSQPIIGALDFHITPKFSVGARYAAYANQLSKEGQSQYDALRAGVAGVQVPEVDSPKSSVMGTVSYYPMYGKLNFFDLTVVQFDFYAIVGYGQMQTTGGTSDTWTAGGGVGFWWNKYLSSRVEIRHQAYTENFKTAPSRDVGMMIGTIGIGLLL
jgi:outer membrane beta-barrel protein